MLNVSGSRANPDGLIRNDIANMAYPHFDKSKTTGPKVSVRHNIA